MEILIAAALLFLLVKFSSSPERSPSKQRPRRRSSGRCGATSRRTGQPCGSFAVKGRDVCRAHGGVPLTFEEETGYSEDEAIPGEFGSYFDFQADLRAQQQQYEAQVRRNNVQRHNQTVRTSAAVERQVNGRRFDGDKVPMRPLRDSEYARRDDRDTVRRHFETDAGRKAFDKAYPKDRPFRP